MNSLENTEQSRIDFCFEFKISDDDWTKADISWATLLGIGEDHVAQLQSLSVSAAMYANLIQSLRSVHSVRWRIKNHLHLIAKIVRKRAESNVEYANISTNNYHEVITDLVGIRALHLLKSDFADIHQQLLPLFSEKEPPVAYIRSGDPDDVVKAYKNIGLEVKVHPAGYRSIHYVKTVRPINRLLHMEIQVRTVFEEGWSEIDHRVRYPNFSSDPLIMYASQILNRLSGMADEMSTYAMQLTNSLSARSVQIEEFRQERDDALERIDQLVQVVEKLKDGDISKATTIKKLKEELVALRTYAARDAQSNALASLGASQEVLGFSLNDAVLQAYRENALAGGRSSVEDIVRGLGAHRTKKD